MRKIILVSLLVILTACSSGSSDPTLNFGLELGGPWRGRVTFQGSNRTLTFRMNLRHVKDTTGFDGVYSFNTFTGDCFIGGILGGNVVGSRVGITMEDTNAGVVTIEPPENDPEEPEPIVIDPNEPPILDPAVITLSGTTTNRRMEGLFSVTGGPCHNRSGSWSAVKG